VSPSVSGPAVVPGLTIAEADGEAEAGGEVEAGGETELEAAPACASPVAPALLTGSD